MRRWRSRGQQSSILRNLDVPLVGCDAAVHGSEYKSAPKLIQRDASHLRVGSFYVGPSFAWIGRTYCDERPNHHARNYVSCLRCLVIVNCVEHLSANHDAQAANGMAK